MSAILTETAVLDIAEMELALVINSMTKLPALSDAEESIPMEPLLVLDLVIAINLESANVMQPEPELLALIASMDLLESNVIDNVMEDLQTLAMEMENVQWEVITWEPALATRDGKELLVIREPKLLLDWQSVFQFSSSLDCSS